MCCVFIVSPEISLIEPTRSRVELDQNSTLLINVNITGVPQPEVRWQKDNADISRGVVTNTSLNISNVQRTDAGEYELSATNCADVDTKEYDVFIRCK